MKDPIVTAREKIALLYEQIVGEAGSNHPAIEEAFTVFAEVLEELEVADEELRQQNDELLESRHAQLALYHRYQGLFQFAPDAYLVTNRTGIIQEANQAASAMLNVREDFLIGKPFRLFIETTQHRLYTTLLGRGTQAHDIELEILPREQSSIVVSATLAPILDDDGNTTGMRWMLRDITEKKSALAALNASEIRFRTVFNEANLGILLVGLEGRILRTNDAFQNMVSFSDVELYGSQLNALIDPNELERFKGHTRELIQESQRNMRFQTRLVHADGHLIWVNLVMSLVRREGGDAPYLVCMFDDITQEKQAEGELAEMRRRLLESGEVERLHLAQELHDGPMQDLYGSVFGINLMFDSVEDEETKQNLKAVLENIKSVAGTLRSICGELRPPTISNLGLEPAIRSHAERLQDAHEQLHIALKLDADGSLLPDQMRIALFRIYQQCISNVLRHADATRAEISLHLANNQVVLEVQDNGKGFKLPDSWVDLLREGHYGLAGIAERTEALGGEMRVDTAPELGTLVRVTVPVPDHRG